MSRPHPARRVTRRILLLVLGGLVAAGWPAPAAAQSRPAEMVSDRVPHVPRIEDAWWPIAANPDLGALTGSRQQPVDFAIWQAADGTWRLWSCIRNTQCGGKTRLFHGWMGRSLTQSNWEPEGIVMRADPDQGETAGGLQAPHVIKQDGRYLLYYGEWQHIAVAQSEDGIRFDRVPNRARTVGLFGEGPGSNTRDAMVLPIEGRLHCYYTAYPEGKGAVYCRVAEAGDPMRFGPSRRVAAGGAAGSNPYSAECPHVVFLDGFYYLFRTQRYGAQAQTSVYRSADPLNFGIDDDEFLIGTLDVAAPEIIHHDGQWYMAALNPGLDGIRMARLRWKPAEDTR